MTVRVLPRCTRCGGWPEICTMGNTRGETLYRVICPKCHEQTFQYKDQQQALDEWKELMGAYYGEITEE